MQSKRAGIKGHATYTHFVFLSPAHFELYLLDPARPKKWEINQQLYNPRDTFLTHTSATGGTAIATSRELFDLHFR